MGSFKVYEYSASTEIIQKFTGNILSVGVRNTLAANTRFDYNLPFLVNIRDFEGGSKSAFVEVCFTYLKFE